MRVAGEILSLVSKYDSSAAENLKMIIDYLVIASSSRPRDMEMMRDVVARQNSEI